MKKEWLLNTVMYENTSKDSIDGVLWFIKQNLPLEIQLKR